MINFTMTNDEARLYLEQLRWPNGAQCPFCRLHQVTRMQSKRNGLYQCNRCRKQFTVTVGTIFERSHIPLSKWITAFHLLCASKKGMSAMQLSRMLGVTYKSAWFMAHRIRHAMTRQYMTSLQGIVEVDETYCGGKAKNGPRGRGALKKTPVLAILQRHGSIRARVVRTVSARDLRSAIRANVHEDSVIMTDDYRVYRSLDEEFAGHHAVKHTRREYVRGAAHINGCESFFALLKRGLYGSFHHVSRRHLHRYCQEFAFRWDYRQVDDDIRTRKALSLAEGKRLRYRMLTNGQAAKATN